MSEKTKHAATLAAVLYAEGAAGYYRNPALAVGDVAVVGPPRPEIAAADALALIRIGRGVSRWAVRACNGEGHQIMVASVPREGGGYTPGRWEWRWTDADDATKERADKRALDKLQAIADRYGATVKLGGDPRGYVVKLQLASGRHNTWGGSEDGWGVA